MALPLQLCQRIQLQNSNRFGGKVLSFRDGHKNCLSSILQYFSFSFKMSLCKDCWHFFEKKIAVEPIAFFTAFSIGLSQAQCS